MTFTTALSHRYRSSLTAALAAVGVLFAGAAFADRPGEIHPLPEKIQVVPDRGLDIEVWTDRGDDARYCVGDQIAVYFRANDDAWVTILDTDTRGRTHRIFPNRYDREHFVEAGRVYRLPIDGYRFEIEGPPGRETLHALAAYDRRDLRRSAERLMKGYRRTDHRGDRGYHPRDDRVRYDKARSRHPLGEKITVVPVPEDLGYDAVSHVVSDSRRCHTRPTRPWWRR